MAGTKAESAIVEVLYALRDEQIIVVLPYEPGLSAGVAVQRSGLADRYPAIRTGEPLLGVYGVSVTGDYPLKPGDRVEICRPLKADPRDMRRTLLSGGKVMGGAAPTAGPSTRKSTR